MISPDGKQIAFAAVGDIYVMPVGGKPENLTKDQALDTDPAWSPDGSQLAYSSDKDGEHLQLWIRDMRTRPEPQGHRLTTQPQGATWSPDGKRIAFFNVDGMWRVAQMSVVDVATGTVTKMHDRCRSRGRRPGRPTASGSRSPRSRRYTRRFREGTNQVLTMLRCRRPEDRHVPKTDKWYAPVPTLSIDSRGGCGPVWSPDGTKMAAIYEGVLAVWPVSPAGEPLGPPRRITTESAHSPSWAGDSRHILYQSLDKLRIVDIETGETRTGAARSEVHARRADGAHGRPRRQARRHEERDAAHQRRHHSSTATGSSASSRTPPPITPARQVVDASDLTVMPGLVEFHSHLQPDFGEAQGRAWLAFGVTTVRSPGNTPYEAVEDREANEAGVRPGPRVYGTGYLMEWQRVYYKMGIAISSVAPVRDGAAARKGAAARSDQELRPAAGPAAEAHGRVRAQHRRAGRDARDLSRRRWSASTTPSTRARPAAAATRRRWPRCSAATRTWCSCSARADAFSAR